MRERSSSPAGQSSSTQKGGIADRVRDSAVAQLSSQKDRATDGIGSVVAAVRQSTGQLRDQQHETIAKYVEQAADQIDRFTQRLREKDVRELVNDAQRLARRQPAVFIGSAFALGLVAARFLKSSSRNDDDYRGSSWGSAEYERNTAGAYEGAARVTAHDRSSISRASTSADTTHDEPQMKAGRPAASSKSRSKTSDSGRS